MSLQPRWLRQFSAAESDRLVTCITSRNCLSVQSLRIGITCLCSLFGCVRSVRENESCRITFHDINHWNYLHDLLVLLILLTGITHLCSLAAWSGVVLLLLSLLLLFSLLLLITLLRLLSRLLLRLLTFDERGELKQQDCKDKQFHPVI